MRLVNLIVMASLITVAPAFAQSKLRVNGVAAIVNDSIITVQEVEETAGNALEALRRTPNLSPEVYEQKWKEAVTESLETLVNKQLVLEDFKNSGGKMPESLLDDEIRSRIRKRYGDRVTLIKTLKARGQTFEAFRQQEHDQLVLEYMRFKNVSQAVLISPQKIERYYQTNLNTFQVDEQVKLRMIVLNSPIASMAEDIKRLALEVLAKIEEGAAFAEMASIYTEGTQRSEGGDWGWQDRKYLKKGLSDLAFTMKTGQHSGVVGVANEPDKSYWILQYDKTGALTSGRKYSDKDSLQEEKTFEPNPAKLPPAPQEFYLMLVEEKRAAHTRLLEDMRDEIEKTLLTHERARLTKQWVDRLRAKAFVRYF